MERFITFLFLAVIVLNAELVTSSNQHMTCQTVDICSDEEHRGIPGFVNLTAIDMSIQSRIKTELESQKTAINALNATNCYQQLSIKRLMKSVMFLRKENRREKSECKKLNETVTNLMRENRREKSECKNLNETVTNLMGEVSDKNSIILSLQASVQTLGSDNRKMKEDIQMVNKIVNSQCEDGDIYYGGYCFWFDVTNRNFAESESKCKSRHSTAGHIMNRNHYDLVMEKLRAEIPSGVTTEMFWLGLQQDPSNGFVTIISNGMEAPFLTWRRGAPALRPSSTNIFLEVRKVALPAYEGMGDYPPTWLFGVICQYKSL